MEGLRRDINLLSSENRFQRRSTLEKLLALAEGTEGFPDEEERRRVYRELLKPVLRCFADGLEKCRELAVRIVQRMLKVLGDDTLDGILQVAITRVGVDPVQEESEDVRLELMRLATLMCEAHPHDIGPRKLLDYYKVLIEQSLRDPFPDLKKECCRCIAALCQAAPRQVPHIAKNLLEAVKPNLKHKHSAVRREMVKAFSELIMHGAQEILGDTRDNVEQQSTLYLLRIVINDQNDGVRFELLNAIGRWLTTLVERLDHHHRLLPLVLVCTTDPHPKVRQAAIDLLTELGRFHMLDHEDLSIVTTLSNRHISLKDIVWYADDAYPDMSKLTASSSLPQPPGDLLHRPGLGTRMCVADASRRWLPDCLKELVDVDWSIPLSKTSRRHVAMRCLQATVRYTENNALQHLQGILDALYRCVMDDDRELRQEAVFTVQLLGRFITPDHYLPLVMPTAYEGQVKEASAAEVIRTGGADTHRRFPTWFSASTVQIRTSIIIVLDHLLKGAAGELKMGEADQILRACANEDLMDYDQPALLEGLLNILLDITNICQAEGWLSDANQFDYKIFCNLLLVVSAPDSRIREMAQRQIADLSCRVTGTETGIYNRHFANVLESLYVKFNPAFFENLLSHAGSTQAQYTDHIVKLFCTRLADIQYNVNTNSNLKLFTVLNAYLFNAEQSGVNLTAGHIELLLRSVILPHSSWWKGQCAVQFRRAAAACLAAVMTRQPLRRKLFPTVDSEPALLSSLMETLIGCFDTDDADVRFSVVRLVPCCVVLPITEQHTRELMKELLAKFDDARDTIRIATAGSLLAIYQSLLTGQVMERRVADVLTDRSLMSEWVRTALIHMDDTNVELQEAVFGALCEVAKVHKALVQDEVTKVRVKHHTFHWCDRLLNL